MMMMIERLDRGGHKDGKQDHNRTASEHGPHLAMSVPPEYRHKDRRISGP